MHKLCTITGRSGCGKSTLEKRLEESELHLKRAISHTSRAPRDGEENGVTYYFTSSEEMLKMKDNNEFAEFTQYNGNYYGVTFKELETADILVIEPHGLAALRNMICERSLPITLCSFFIDISATTALYRMRNRGDKEEDIYSRIEKDNKHFSDVTSSLYDFIINGEKNKMTVLDNIITIFKSVNLNRGTMWFSGEVVEDEQ